MLCGVKWKEKGRRRDKKTNEKRVNGMKRIMWKDAKIVMGSIKNLNLLKKWLRAFARINFIFIGK